jgi:hypothetical protein
MKALPSWWRVPGWAFPRPRPPRVPLAFTLGTTLLFLLLPALVLRQRPRPQAFGLEKLMASVSLLQSFRAHPDRPVPELWRQRLGAGLGDRLWRAQTRTWWQFWDGSAPGQPFLALSTRGMALATLQRLPVPPLAVGDLVILSPDPVSRQVLSDRLRLQVRPSPGLRLRCLPRLERDQAVFWRPTALGELLGPLAPFLQDAQEGCLTLTLQPDGLSWTGEAASIEGMLLEAPPGAEEGAAVPAGGPSPNDPLLELRGTSLERLLSGLLARELIRQPLAERWGFGADQRALLRDTPFQLMLRPLPRGPFQASIELTVLVGEKEKAWKAALGRLAGNLQKEGLRFHASPPSPPPAPPPSSGAGRGAPKTGGDPPPATVESGQSLPSGSSPPAVTDPWPTALWAREDGVVVGGWQGRSTGGRMEQITFFLGPKAGQPDALRLSNLPRGGGMRLMARPQELALRGLLPPDLPEVVQRSHWLWWTSEPYPGFGRNAPLSQLQGSLSLRP